MMERQHKILFLNIAIRISKRSSKTPKNVSNNSVKLIHNKVSYRNKLDDPTDDAYAPIEDPIEAPASFFDCRRKLDIKGKKKI